MTTPDPAVDEAADRHDEGAALLEELRDIGLFGGLTDEVLAALVSELKVVDLEPGDVVFRENERGREMFVLLSGEMEVVKQSKRDVRSRVAMLGPGDWFGEMSILDVMPRSATVRAVAYSRALRIGATDLDSLYRRDAKSYALLVLNVAREMSRRLRVADALLAELATAPLAR
jgi:CRP/FNR family cyclic AMP-dependent transcriptional regulator